MKRISIYLLSTIFILLAVLTFVSCTKDDAVDNETESGTTQIKATETTEEETVSILFVSGISGGIEKDIDKTESSEAEPVEIEAAEILRLYNATTAKTAQQKVSFIKHRETTEKTYDAGFVLEKFKPLVYKFMGIGPENIYVVSVERNADNYSKHFLESKLTESDINSASCTEDENGNTTITMFVKNGSSSVVDGEVKSEYAPIDKCGISAGKGDKDYYDHKPAQNVIAAIDDFGPAAKATISESYSNAKLTAVIDANGNLTSLVVTFDFSFEISNILGSSGVATASTKVVFSDFKW